MSEPAWCMDAAIRIKGRYGIGISDEMLTDLARLINAAYLHPIGVPEGEPVQDTRNEESDPANETPETLTALLRRVGVGLDRLATAESELGSIRATLIVNFGSVARVNHGVTIDETKSTQAIMLSVLQQLVAKQRGNV